MRRGTRITVQLLMILISTICPNSISSLKNFLIYICTFFISLYLPVRLCSILLLVFSLGLCFQRINPADENWTRYQSGRAARELTNPDGPSENRTSYSLTHTAPVRQQQQQQPYGRQTQWHRHNILTGGANSQTRRDGNVELKARALTAAL